MKLENLTLRCPIYYISFHVRVLSLLKEMSVPFRKLVTPAWKRRNDKTFADANIKYEKYNLGSSIILSKSNYCRYYLELHTFFYPENDG